MVPYGTDIWKKQWFMTAARISSLRESIFCQRIYVRLHWNAVNFHLSYRSSAALGSTKGLTSSTTISHKCEISREAAETKDTS